MNRCEDCNSIDCPDCGTHYCCEPCECDRNHFCPCECGSYDRRLTNAE